MIVLLPHPEGPTIAVEDPALIVKLTPSSTFYKCLAAVGYLKTTFLKWIPVFSSNDWSLLFISYLSTISESLSITSNIALPTTLDLTTACKLGLNVIKITNPSLNANIIESTLAALYGTLFLSFYLLLIR